MAPAATSKQSQQKAAKAMGVALSSAKEALAMAKKLGEKPLVAQATYCLGTVHLLGRACEDGLKAAVQAESIFDECSDAMGVANAVVLQAEAKQLLEEADEAVALAKRGMALAKDLGDSSAERRAQQVIMNIQGGAPPPGFQPQQQQPRQGAATATTSGASEPAAAQVAKKGLDLADVKMLIAEEVRNIVGEEDIDEDTPLMDSGLDSLSSVQFRNDLQKKTGLNLPASIMFDYPTQRALAERIVEMSMDD